MLSACGFQLRGAGTSHLSSAQISLSISDKLESNFELRNFHKELKRSLKQSGAELIIGAQPNSTQLNIVSLNFHSQGVSRDATGRANEYEVILRLEYQINEVNTQEREVKANILSLESTANYYQDYRNPAAGQVQKNETQQLLISQIIQSLIHQLEFQLKN